MLSILDKILAPGLLIVLLIILFILLIILIVYIGVKSIHKPEENKEKTEQKIINYTKNEIKNNEDHRFYQLNKIDENMSDYHEYFDDDINLEEICEQFQNFSAYQLHLYFDLEDIRKFVSSLAITKLIILQGMSGTGKTSLGFAFGEFIKNSSIIVPIQPMWKERTDLIGYYNEFTKKFNETTILQKMYLANYKKDMFITVLDEMNIARVEYYFAEFLSLLELPNPDSRYLDVVNDVWENDPILLKNGKIKLPDNMWFIGTINNDDSTFAISDKVYDRAMILNLDKRSHVIKSSPTEGVKFSCEHFNALVKNALEEFNITARNKKRIQMLDKYLINTFGITFGNRVMKQLYNYVPVYLACGGSEEDAIDDFIAKKVLRKLESLNQVYVRNQTDQFISYLDELFGRGTMKICIAYMNKLRMNS